MWGAGSVADQGGFLLDIDIHRSADHQRVERADAQLARCDDDARRGHDELLKGQHSFSLGAIVHAGEHPLDQSDAGAGSGLRHPAERSGERDVRARELPRRVGGRHHARAESLRGADGARVVGDGNARIDEDTGEYTYLGPATQRARMRDLGFFLQDQWRIEAEPHHQRRPALRAAVAVHRAQQQLCDGDNGGHLRRVGRGRTGTAATCSSRGAGPGVKPTFVNLQKGAKASDIDWNNLAPNVGFNWSPSAASGLAGAVLGEQGDTSSAAASRWSYNRNGMTDFTGVFGANPGVLIDATAVRASAISATAAAAVPRSRAARPAGVREHAAVSDDRRRDRRRQHLRSATCRCRGASRGGRRAALDRRADGGRSPLRRHAQRDRGTRTTSTRSTSSRTAS